MIEPNPTNQREPAKHIEKMFSNLIFGGRAADEEAHVHTPDPLQQTGTKMEIDSPMSESEVESIVTFRARKVALITGISGQVWTWGMDGHMAWYLSGDIGKVPSG